MRGARNYIFWFVAAAVVLFIAWYSLGSSRTPQGQPQLSSLTETNVAQFGRDFNRAGNDVRMVLLLSPT
jgi:hypothetical protein